MWSGCGHKAAQYSKAHASVYMGSLLMLARYKLGADSFEEWLPPGDHDYRCVQTCPRVGGRSSLWQDTAVYHSDIKACPAAHWTGLAP